MGTSGRAVYIAGGRRRIKPVRRNRRFPWPFDTVGLRPATPHPMPRTRLNHAALISLLAAALALAACGDTARLSVTDGTGPSPRLPEPQTSLVPTVKIARVKGWSEGETPVAAAGLRVNAFAEDLDHPRWLLVLPNRDVLVAETNAPTPHDEGSGVKGWIMRQVMGLVGAAVPSADRIVLLRDTDGDGRADARSVLIEGLHSPFGMALAGDDLYVANTDAVLRFPYRAGATRIDEPGVKVADLPAGPINHHWTKSLLASPDGRRLYVGVGSNSNAAENGIEAEYGRAAIWEIDPGTGAHRVFASGLRNPVGLDWEPASGTLWTAVNERDELGSDLVPDYMTSVRDGGFYGWPYSYYGAHVDTRVEPQRPELVATALVPDYALGPHTASLGLAFARDAGLPAPFASGAFVGQHGSWNRDPPSGYKVVFVPFVDGSPAGLPFDVLTGFLDQDGKARGRPVGVAFDGRGGLLVADDVGNRIWRVTAAR
jgi:glucose/arabinose dehydrogenase